MIGTRCAPAVSSCGPYIPLGIHPDRCAGTRPRSTPSLAATPCSRAGPARPGLYSDFPTILESIAGRLGKLPGNTVTYTGHGDSTTIGDEIAHYDDWVARGH